MSEPRIGRVFVASLHQAIADVLPSRLEFYENWLSSAGLRAGTIGLAPLTAVLSFLRREGAEYDVVTQRAGQYAADYTVAALPLRRRVLIRLLPSRFRARAALRLARELVRTTYGGTRTVIRFRRGEAVLDIRGSLFCAVREASATPLCGFYAAAVAQLFERLGVSGAAQVSGCRAKGDAACLISVALVSARSEGEEVAAA